MKPVLCHLHSCHINSPLICQISDSVSIFTKSNFNKIYIDDRYIHPKNSNFEYFPLWLYKHQFLILISRLASPKIRIPFLQIPPLKTESNPRPQKRNSTNKKSKSSKTTCKRPFPWPNSNALLASLKNLLSKFYPRKIRISRRTLIMIIKTPLSWGSIPDL